MTIGIRTHFRGLSYAAAGLTAAAAITSGAAAQNLINSNTTIHSSLCIGSDCATSESYGSDTLRLKENNLRIHFDDTSVSSSFPNNDWRIVINDSTNGGLNRFSIEDVTGGSYVSTIEAGAPANALYVDDRGHVGLGTASPAVEIHAVEGDTPTLRLEQDGSSGFSAQTWDMAGNEAGFFVRDVTHGSTLPFRIRPDAPSQALVVDSDGDVGVGILTASASLHVRRSDGTAHLLVEELNATTTARGLATLRNNGIVFMTLEDTSLADVDDSGRAWNIQNQAGTLRFTTAPGGAGDIELQLDTDGNMTLEGTLTTTGTTCGGGCDKVFDADYALPSIAEHEAEMFANRHLPNVGPTPEGAPINVSEKLGGMLNELEKAHIYIGQLNQQLQTQQAEKSDEIAQLNARLATLEAMLISQDAQGDK